MNSVIQQELICQNEINKFLNVLNNFTRLSTICESTSCNFVQCIVSL